MCICCGDAGGVDGGLGGSLKPFKPLLSAAFGGQQSEPHGRRSEGPPSGALLWAAWRVLQLPAERERPPSVGCIITELEGNAREIECPLVGSLVAELSGDALGTQLLLFLSFTSVPERG